MFMLFRSFLWATKLSVGALLVGFWFYVGKVLCGIVVPRVLGEILAAGWVNLT